MKRPPPALDPKLVLGAYTMGVFPMADARDAESVYWVEPRRRAILPLDGFHLSRSLRKTILADRFRVTADGAFGDVLRLCAESVENRPETWINASIEQVFGQLHAMGYAHSIECWDGERLAGGLYGLALGRAFFGESMVSRAPDGSKVAIAALVARLITSPRWARWRSTVPTTSRCWAPRSARRGSRLRLRHRRSRGRARTSSRLRPQPRRRPIRCRGRSRGSSSCSS
jgi:leucyl/phenylalanyl-tRNA--protein transferase